MILRKIKLENIRSYENSEIEFPEDLVLLSGNVGSGKSSILLAIDFALFGIRRGELSGGALLRKGCSKGSVNLSFSIDDKEIEIQRSLKKSNDSIVQDAGFISINGSRRDGTAVELKQSILEILNYPAELLTKNKSLIYRYTVYTPQEEMKQILLGEKDFRVDTLRKVFGVDKYKRIKENSLVFVRYLKEEIREFRGRLADYDDKKKLLEDKKKNLEEVKLNLSRLGEEVNNNAKEVNRVKAKLKEIEEQSSKLKEFKHKLELLEVKVKNEKDKLSHNEIEVNEAKKQVMQLRLEISKEVKVDDSKIESLKLEITNSKKKLKEVETQISEFTIKKQNSESVKATINRLDVCPTCKREVLDIDKLKISKSEDEKIADFSGKIMFNEPKVLDLNKKIVECEKELDSLREVKASSEAVELKKKNLDEKNSLLKRLEEEIGISKNSISNSEADKGLVLDEVKGLENIEKEFISYKELLEKVLIVERELDIKKNSFEKDVSSLDESVNELSVSLEEMDKVKANLGSNEKLMGWLNTHFVNLMNIIERKIMLRVHADFDSLFKKWFDMLIDDELLDVKLDEEFTPVIEQNGHLIDYLHLSGGEKTAAALAYRLALNQVVNNLMSVIKTRDLLILDEPTDGFSEEQIEKMKDVLLELKNKQTVIVSHENRIESFVSNVIRLEKVGHVSSVSKSQKKFILEYYFTIYSLQ